jgi:hypothetical protein
MARKPHVFIPQAGRRKKPMAALRTNASPL